MTTADALADDAALAASLVRDAGTLARRMRDDGLEQVRKTSVSDIVTAADHAAEELVVRRLREARPEDGIVGEEGTEHPSSSGRTWVIDPVDGTYNFFHGVPWWCSALALTDGDDVRLGAVFGPQDGSLWLGGPSLPTTRDGVPVEPLADPPLGTVSAATYLHPTRLADPGIAGAWARAASLPATVRMLGSASMDLSAVADGRLGVWFQHGVAAWDWLPGCALVLGAGGAATQVDAGGVTWSVAGTPSAVRETVAALVGG
jgi:myo-inositol-1(or 4)-monophosphatase